MGIVDTYVVQADPLRALAVTGTDSPFRIEIRFLDGLTLLQMDAFKTAADRWSRIIVGALPKVQVGDGAVDGVVILARGVSIDGPGRELGKAAPTFLRPRELAATALLPAQGELFLDTEDLARMEETGSLVDTITHEMGHVLGIGTIWDRKLLLRGAGTGDPRFVGPLAMQEYGALRGLGPTSVPVENRGGAGPQDSHWRESVFRRELMSSVVERLSNPLSRVTVASLSDLGYAVDFAAAETFDLPGIGVLAEGGLPMPAATPRVVCTVHGGGVTCRRRPSGRRATGGRRQRAPRVLPLDSLVL